MKRREFLNKAAIGTVSGVGLISIAAGICEILPRETESYSKIRIGKPDDFPLNEFTYLSDKKLYFYRSRQTIRVLSAVCTHLGCTIQKSEEGFRCPCHGSIFDKTGKACSGPASRPLDRPKVEIDKKGIIVVDLKKTTMSDYILS